MSREVRHVAAVLDGNGRWALENGKDIREGHFAGFNKFREMALHLLDYHPTVTEFSGWAFAPSNIKRPLREVVGIFLLMARNIGPLTDELMEKGVCFKVLGDMNRIPSMARKELQKAIDRTSKNTRLTVGLNIMYDGREDVLQSMRKLAISGQINSNTSLDTVDQLITSELSTRTSSPVDLLFIPGSSKGVRPRDFFLWHMRNAHVHGIDTPLPDVTMEELDFAISRAGSSTLTDGGRKS